MSKGHHLKKITAFVSVLVLFFVLSMPAFIVYAKMKPVEDKDLAEIQGAQGLTIGLDLKIDALPSLGGKLRLTDESGNYIYISGMGLRLTDANWSSVNITTNVTMDVGANSGRTMVYLGGLVLPTSTSYITGSVNINGQDIGALNITNLYIGSNTTNDGVGGNLTINSTPWVRFGTHSNGQQGIEGMASAGVYVNKLNLAVNNNGNSGFFLTDLYIYAPTNDSGNANSPTTWTMTGPALIGYDTSHPFSVDVGSGGGTTIVRLSLPMAANIRIANVRVSDANFGPISLDNVYFYRQWVDIRNNL